MIEVKGVSKRFDKIRAVNHIDMEIRDGAVFGLVGTNGAGKSTLLRMIAGVLKCDEGEILADGEKIFENPAVKQNVCFLSDTVFYYPNATPQTMADAYACVYPHFDMQQFHKMTDMIHMDEKRQVRTFSKGMKRQLSVVLGVCTRTKYLLCDEVFDGLDPVIRQAVKSIFATEMLDRDFVPVIASHNLRELEDFCDHVGLLHEGGVLLSEDLDDAKFHMQKVQCVMCSETAEETILRSLDVLFHQKRGSLLTVIARGTSVEVMDTISRENPLFVELLPLTLEEIFIYETEVAGYDIKNILS